MPDLIDLDITDKLLLEPFKRDSETALTYRLKWLAWQWLYTVAQCRCIGMVVRLEGPGGKVVDLAAVGPENVVYVVEVKSSKSDFARDNHTIEDLNALQARSKALNRTDDASSLEYYAADKKRRDTWKSNETSIAEKAQAALEYAVWGSITGYGTKLDRVLLIAMSFWLLGSLPLIVIKDKLYRISAPPRNSDSPLRDFRFRAASAEALSSSARQSRSLFERILVTLGFSFALMFKVPINIRYVESDAKPIGMHPMERYLAILWVLGAFLLVLVGLTLAKTSPIVSKIVGELF